MKAETVPSAEESVINESDSQVISQITEIEESTTSTEIQEENGSNTGLISGIVIAVIIIVGAAAAIIIKTCIKNK